jgi:Ca2+-binding RTX toxin-like protein
MARVTYQLYPGFFTDQREIDEGSITSGNSKKAVFTDFTSGDKLIFEGKGLDYEKGIITEGMLQKLSVVGADGEMYFSLRGFKVDASFLTGTTVLEQVSAFTQNLLQMDLRLICTNLADAVAAPNGDDLVFGRRGDDTLSGGLGRDEMIGGAGNDVFVFSEGFGRDRIRDFDAVGGDGMQDHIEATFEAVDSIHRSGRNTVIDFGDGDTLTLLNVRRAEIDPGDFQG